MKKKSMRKLLHLLLLIALVGVPWVTMSQSFNFTCDFESDADTAAWDYANSTSVNNQWYIGSAINNGGSRSLYISNDGGVSNAYTSESTKVFAYRTLTLQAGNYEYSYDWKAYGESNYDFIRAALAPASATFPPALYDIDDETLPDGWISLDGNSFLCDAFLWETQSGMAYVPTDGDYKLVFYWACDAYGASQPPAAIDNISLSLPSCPSPVSVQALNIHSNTAMVKWNGSTASVWEVTYAPQGSLETAGISQLVYVDSLELVDLNPNTLYQVSVRSVCGDEYSRAEVISFRTGCADITLPYHEGFESFELYEAPMCWTVLAGRCDVRPNSMYAPHTNEGTQYLNMSSSGEVASSFINHPCNLMEVSFSLQFQDDEAGAMQVFVVPDLSQMDHAVLVKTIAYADDEIHEYDVDCSSSGISTGGYLVFKQVDPLSNYSYQYLDDITISVLSDCRRPAAMSASNITYESATLNWTAVEGAYAYEVVYGQVNDPTSLMNTTISDVVDNSVEIMDLEPETQYYIWVRNNCGGENSAWRAGGSFTTQIACSVVDACSVSNITATGAVLSWNYNHSIGKEATQAQLRWGIRNMDMANQLITDHQYYIIQDLQPSTTYDYELRTICGQDTSAIYRGSFTTQLYGVTVEGNGNYTSDNIPTDCYYKNSYAQMLYTPTELLGVDTIRSIAFKMESTIEMNRTWDIYMGHTMRNALTGTNYVDLDSLTLVGNNVTFSTGANWRSVALNIPFAYHNDSNLVIAIYDTTFTTRRGISFYMHEGSSVGCRSDYSTIDPANPPTLSSFTLSPDIAFVMPYVEGSCGAPMLAIGETTSTSVQLVWNGGNDGETWQVEYKLRSEEEWSVSITPYADTSFVVDGLQPGTYYQFRVGTICDDGIHYSEVVEKFTDCAAVEVPYTEDFSGPALNPCWVYGNDQDEDGPYLNYDALYMNYSAGGYAILPAMVEEINSMHMLFSIKSSRQDARLVVAVGEEVGNASTFEAIDTFYVTSTSDYIPQECNFSNYMGEGHYIAFYTLDKNIYIDDITVDVLPDCSYPTHINVSDVQSTAATLSWEGSTGTTQNWLLVYNIQGDPMADTLTLGADETIYTLSDLQPNTNYEVLILNVCTNDTVAALAPVTFKTECGELTLPYFEDFENEVNYGYPACWHSTNQHTYGPYNKVAPQIVTQYSDHVNVMQFNDNVNMITPRIPVAINTVSISFDAKVDDTDYSGDLAIGYTFSSTDASQAVYIDTIEFVNDLWHHYDFSFTSLTENQEAYIIFNNINNAPYESYGYADYYGGYIDNLVVMVDYGCGQVSDIQISEVTAHSAKVSYSDATDANDYTIGYSTINDVNNIPNFVESTDDFATISGLQPYTTYYTWVRINCNGGSGLWVAGPSFRTPCVAIDELPYEENFDSYSEGISYSDQAPNSYPDHTLPACWSFLNMSTAQYVYPQAYISNSNSSRRYADSAACLMMKSEETTPIYAILPEFVTHVEDLQISFTYCNEGLGANNGTLALGVMTDINNPATFVSVCDYPQADNRTYVMHNFSLDNLSSSENYVIAFRYTAGATSQFLIGIDNIKVETASACVIPEMISLIDVSDVTATFVWNNVANSYNVQYRLSTETEWTDAPAVDTSKIVLTNLVGQSDYQLRIQSVCGASVSSWSHIVDFATTCGNMSLPYAEDFDGYTEDISSSQTAPNDYPNHTMPNCWTFPVLDSPTPRAFLSTKDGYATTGNCLFFVSNGNKNIYAVLPKMDAPINSLQMSFSYRNESVTSSNSPLQLGVVTNPNDISTFVSLETYPLSAQLSSVEHNFSSDEQLMDNTNYYIAFCYGGSSGGYFLSIDDVVVDYVPTCIRPEVNEIDSVTSTTAYITWVSEANNFQVEYKQESAMEWQSIAVTDTNAELTNLNSSTIYNVRVRAICSEGDTSHWSVISTFKTGCGVGNLPFAENFTGITSLISLDCWNNYSGQFNELTGTASFSRGSAWMCGSRYEVNNGGNNVHINIFGTGLYDWLLTPTVYLSGVTNLEFDINRYDYNDMYDADDKFAVLITTNDGATWSVLQSWDGVAFETSFPSYFSTAAHISIDLAQYMGDTVRIAFYGESTVAGADHIINIDNISIPEPTTPLCEAPTNLAVNNITETAAQLSWNGNAVAYDVEYKVQNTEAWTTVNATETSYALSALQPATAYDWRVRSNCGEVTSDWVTSTFTTLTPTPTCDVPTNLAVNNITENTVDLSWNGNATTYDVEYKVQGTMAWTTLSATTNSYNLTGLQPATAYDWRVRANCGETTSAWVTSTFTTAAATPTCDVPTDVAVSNITETSAHLSWNGTATSYYVDYRTSEATEWTSVEVYENSLDLTALQPATAYDWRVCAKCGELTSEWVMNSFITLTSAPTCDVPTELSAVVNQQSVTLDWTVSEGQDKWEISLKAEDSDEILQTVTAHPTTLNDLDDATYTFKVRAICADDVYSDWSEAIQFTIEETFICEAVTNVEAINITENSAIVTWTAGDDQDKWQLVYGEAGFDYHAAEPITVEMIEYRMENLEANTAYDVYVRAVCDEGFYSIWSDKYTFQTLESHEGIDGVEGQYELSIYPNPAHGATTISLSGIDGKVTISILDINGRQITSESQECNADCEKRIDVTNLAQGTYFIRVVGDNINSVRKLIVR